MSFLLFFPPLPEDDGTRLAEMAIEHIGHAIKATWQHSSSLTNFTFPLTLLSINLLLFYLPYVLDVLAQHVSAVQNISLLPWHTTFACQLSQGTSDQSVFYLSLFLLGTTQNTLQSLLKRKTLSLAELSHHTGYWSSHMSSMSLTQLQSTVCQQWKSEADFCKLTTEISCEQNTNKMDAPEQKTESEKKRRVGNIHCTKRRTTVSVRNWDVTLDLRHIEQRL